VFSIVRPTIEHLPRYVAALKRGWSPSTHEDNSLEELRRVERDPVRFITFQEDRDGKGDPIRLPDGSAVPRLPYFARWMWDGDFAGMISFRWQPGTADLPPWSLGHIGYSVVAWKRRRGYATEALRLMLLEVRLIGLPYVEIMTSESNVASRRVITENGGVFVAKAIPDKRLGRDERLRYRITL
jgi:predicted acetyltransferase